ncbi:Dabb family protein [Balneolales bacterium ANBcel1]|nr:Dabb family protein [Balneolales bacterium ANBcel1]
MILHSVFFYLKDSCPAETASNMKADIETRLTNIEQVNDIWAGAPEGVDRDVVDNEYHMSLHVFFEDIKALQAYQVDPGHVEFVETYKPYFERIKVFDTRVG